MNEEKILKENELKYQKALKIFKAARNLYFKNEIKFFMKGWELLETQIKSSDAIIEEMIKPFFWKYTKTINFTASRQTGKTFSSTGTLSLMTLLIPFYFKINKYILGIVVNKNTQVEKILKKFKENIAPGLKKFNLEIIVNNHSNFKISNWVEIVTFSMEAKNNESDSLNFCFIDEAQALNGEKYLNEIDPMFWSTWGSSLFVWVWWKIKNLFYQNLQDPEQRNFKLPANKVIEEIKNKMEEIKKRKSKEDKNYVFENDESLNTYKFTLKKINDARKNKDAFSMQYDLNWNLALWNFLNNINDLKKFSYDYEYDLWEGKECYVWIDVAKHQDRTVVTVVAKEKEKYKILNWYQIKDKGINYFEQIKKINLFLNIYWDNIKKYYIDWTWVWEGFIDWFIKQMRNPKKVKRITFSTWRKNKLWQNFQNILDMNLLKYPKNNNCTENFENEMVALEKSYNLKSELSYKHPSKNDSHDDFVDSTFLAFLALEETTNNKEKRGISIWYT